MIVLSSRHTRAAVFLCLVAAVLLALNVFSFVGAASAQDANEHCPGGTANHPAPDGFTVEKVEVGDDFGDTLTLDPGTQFCVKAATHASGILTMPDSGSWSTPDEWSPGEGGPDISYYVIYTPVDVDVTVEKVWLDAEGAVQTGVDPDQLTITVDLQTGDDVVLDESDFDADWTASFTIDADDAVVSVTETTEPTGYDPVACPDTVTSDADHVVCNQQEADTVSVLPDVVEREQPAPDAQPAPEEQPAVDVEAGAEDQPAPDARPAAQELPRTGVGNTELLLLALLLMGLGTAMLLGSPARQRA